MQNMNNTRPKLPWRMAVGHYALNKLACGGLAFSLLSLLSLLLTLLQAPPEAFGQVYSSGWPIQIWAYGFGLPAALAADAVIDRLNVPDKSKQAALYFTTGFGLFLILAYYSVPRLTGVSVYDVYAGIFVTFIYMTCRRRWVRESFVPIMLAFVLPLLCMIIGQQ